MALVAGDYRVEVRAPGYESREVMVAHGPKGPTILEVDLERIFEPGDVFTDVLRSDGEGPEMVVIPAGRFRMGCVSGLDCFDDEKPVHEVTFPRAFALSVHEVPFEDYDRFTYPHKVDDSGWGRGR